MGLVYSYVPKLELIVTTHYSKRLGLGYLLAGADLGLDHQAKAGDLPDLA